MKKRAMGMLLSLVLTISAMGIAVPMAAMADSMMVVTVGADLSDAERQMILNYFNVAGQSYTTITVTNEDEWSHLGGYMSRDIVGYRTISCALIRPMTSGGIQVKTANLTYVTSNMIASSLATAGVTNCEVLAAAPFQVSGTGALTGALMAYENLSGVTLDESKKQAAAQEFATTYELGQTIGQQEAQQIVNDVKMQVINGVLEDDHSITNEEIVEIVNDVVNNYTTNNTTNTTNTTNNTTNTTNNTTNTTNITNNTGLSESDIAALQSLAVQIAKESYEQGTIDALAQIQKTLEGQTQTSSTAATTQIEQGAAPTTDEASAASADNAPADAALSAADQALSQDSLLTKTNEEALASTSPDGSVVSTSTSESSITSTVATNLDTQIEQKAAEQTDAAPANTDTGIPEAVDSTVLGGDTTTDTAPDSAPADDTGIPEAVDSTVLGGDTTTDTAPDSAPADGTGIPEAVDSTVPGTGTATDTAADSAPADGTGIPEAVDSTVLGTGTATDTAADAAPADNTGIPEAVDSSLAGTDTASDAAATDPALSDAADDGTADNGTNDAGTVEGTSDDAGTAEGTGDGYDTDEGTQDGTAVDTGADQDRKTITAADIDNVKIKFTTGSNAETENGTQPASGLSAVEVVVPYENLTPVSGALHVTAGSGAEAAYLNIDPSESNLVLLTSADSYDVPAGSTKILMVPKDNSDISLQTDFTPAAGETYTYTLNAQFNSADGVLDIQIYNYDPYYGNPVSEKGFSVSGSCLNRSVSEGVSGSVLFPSDGSAAFATVAADGQSMANVSVTSAADGSMLGGVTAGTGDVVDIAPVQSGAVTLTITYYAAAPEDGFSVDPAQQTGTAQYTIYFR